MNGPGLLVGGTAAALAVTVGVFTGGALLAGLAATAGATPPSALAETEIPPSLLAVYEQAATARCPRLPWQVLAAVGFAESRHADGRADPATGQVDPPIFGPALDGSDGTQAIADPAFADGWAHAEGPMQFLPSTWAGYATLAPGRPVGAVPDPQNAWDAIYAAARFLCAEGAGTGDLHGAIVAYDHSEAYYASVWAKAIVYGMATGAGLPAGPVIDPGAGRTFAGDANVVVAYALSQLGVAYEWGGTTPGVALDCSGLVYVSYLAAGLALPRSTFDQVDYGVTVPVDQLAAGDLLFFRGGTPIVDFGHVALYLGRGLMIQAPHTGAVVQITLVPYNDIELARRILVPAGP